MIIIYFECAQQRGRGASDFFVFSNSVMNMFFDII